MHSPLIFFFNDTATTEIYTLSLHDALPISSGSSSSTRPRSARGALGRSAPEIPCCSTPPRKASPRAKRDRKSTRLNSSHQIISYAVFCLKKKNDSEWSVKYSVDRYG